MHKYKLFYIVLCCGFCFVWCEAVSNKRTRVCVIGAGVGGLSAARYLKEEGIDFTVLESTRYVGGTWRYDPRVGKDENGLPLHTSMYKHLRTNLPKPTMELRGYPLPDYLPSFPSWNSYYCYLQAYANHFGLMKDIQLLHNVESVRRVNDVWTVKHRHVITGKEFEEEYDFVIVATGHHSKPNYPNIPGEKLFKGRIIHSHDFRETEPYKDRKVLIVGAGPSGMDIGLDVANVAHTLVHSHYSKVLFKTAFPKNFIVKPDVKEFNQTGAIFVDGSYEELDEIIYCTGYRYDYPFLDASSQLELDPHYVAPLYKYMINIHHPSMILLGLTVRACLVVALDAQARYATALIKGNFSLPPRDEMLAEHQKRVHMIKSSGLRMSTLQLLAYKEDEYYAELTRESGIERVPPVLYKIRISDMLAKIDNLYTYRNYSYTVIDSERFVKYLEDPERRNHKLTCSP